ncbi:hypothetical protein PT2222_80135 [Paraburkholderia tropica]
MLPCSSRANAPCERIVVGENELRLRAHVRRAANARAHVTGREIAAAFVAFVARLEHAADDALLLPHGARRKRRVGGEAGDLRARAGAARRAVVRLAGAQHEVAAVEARRRRIGEQFDMVDQRAALARDAIRFERLANRPGHIRERFDVGEVERLAVIGDEEEPVAAPRDIAMDAAEARHVDRHVGAVAIRGHVAHGHAAVGVQFGFDIAHRRFDAMHARRDAAHVRERHDQADRAVSAHAEKAHVVEENDARRTGRIVRLAEQRADHHVGAARLADDACAHAVEVAAENLEPLGERSAAQLGAAFGHEPRGLAAGMGIDDGEGFHAVNRRCRPRGRLVATARRQ